MNIQSHNGELTAELPDEFQKDWSSLGPLKEAG